MYFAQICSPYWLWLFSCLSQGDIVWKGQFNECWEPGDRLWSNVNATTRAECLGNPEWHEATETSGAAVDRAWRCLILKDYGLEGPQTGNEGQLFITCMYKRKFKPPWI